MLDLLIQTTIPAPLLQIASTRDTALRNNSTMNPFTTHPQQQGITYLEHWCFAMGTACRLLSSVVALGTHALFPFIPIKPELDLEATAAFLKERNEWIEAAKGRRTGHSCPGLDDKDIGATNSKTDNPSLVV